jgi:hypothetical protein
MPVILATPKAEVGRITVQNQLEQKVLKTPTQPIKRVQHDGHCTCHPNYAGSVNKRIKVQLTPGINARPY